MGGFYANVVVETNDVDAVLDVVRSNNLPAAVASDGRFIVVADERLDEQDVDWMEALAAQISERTGKTALGALVHDDDILLMALATPGADVHSYHSMPSYFGLEDSELPTGGDASLFAAALGRPAAAEALDPILNAGLPDEDDDVSPYYGGSDRHTAIAEVLGLPLWSVWFGYASLEEFPPAGFEKSYLRHYGPV